MEPADVATSMQVANQTEQVRQASVKSLFDSMNTMAAINRSEQAGDLDSAQAESLRGRLQGQIRLDAAQAFQAEQHGGVFEATKQRIQKMSDAEVTKLVNEGNLVAAQVQTENALRNSRNDLLNAQANNANASAELHNVQASIAEQNRGLTRQEMQARIKDLENVGDSWVDVPLANGKSVKLRGSTYAEVLKAQADQQRLSTTKDTTTEAANIERDETRRRELEKENDEANQVESQIMLNRDTKPDAAIPLVDTFNKKSTKNYLMVPTTKNRAYGVAGGILGTYGAVSKVAIPRTVDPNTGKEVQMTARELSALAARQSPRLTPEEYLDQLYTKIKKKPVVK